MKEELTLEPVAIKRLKEMVGTAEACKQLGISHSHFNKMAAGQPARAAIELAARHIISKLDKQNYGEHTLLVRCPADKVAVIEAVVSGVNGQLLDLTNSNWS